ncbi:unnamed protein product [Rotaria sordida]|uniref:Kinesin light chain n=1 Tax=Rotaria sordida TaxID=392033 RepID=A0A819HXT8_9BILA|nr:unnamed protein product [Rotaria sordida]CAF3907454.1 unnamed protein product [Rotaria sordida]
MGDDSKAFLFLEKALKIHEKLLSSNHPLLAVSYAGIAKVYYNMDDYSKALPCFERAVHIGQHSLPSDHPNLQQYNIGLKMLKEKM